MLVMRASMTYCAPCLADLALVREAVTRFTEQALNPLIGKSIVVYARKPPGVPLPAAPLSAAGKTEPARAHARG